MRGFLFVRLMNSSSLSTSNNLNNFWPELRLALLSVLLYLSGLFVWFTPLPLVYAAFYRGPHSANRVFLYSTTCISLLYLFLAVPLYQLMNDHPTWGWILPVPGLEFLSDFVPRSVTLLGIGYFIFFAGIGLYVVRVYFKPAELLQESTKAVGLGVLFLSVVMWGAGYFSHINLYDWLLEILKSGWGEWLDAMKQSGVPIADMLTEPAVVERILSTFLGLTPAFTFMWVLLVFAMNLSFARRFLLPISPALASVPFNRWSPPFIWVWGFIGALAGIMASYEFHSALAMALFLNVFLICVCLFFLNGLNCVTYVFDRFELPRFVRLFFYGVLLFVFQIVAPLLIVLGLADAWLHLRARIEKRK